MHISFKNPKVEKEKIKKLFPEGNVTNQRLQVWLTFNDGVVDKYREASFVSSKNIENDFLNLAKLVVDNWCNFESKEQKYYKPDDVVGVEIGICGKDTLSNHFLEFVVKHK